MTDAELLDRARSGNEAAFLEIYQRYRAPIYRFAWRLTGCAESAQDLTHDCFVAALKDGARLDLEKGGIRNYLFGIAHNLAMKYFRERARGRLSDDRIDPIDPAPGPLEMAVSNNLASHVARTVAELPDLQREALILFEYEDLSLTEIARITGTEPGTIKARLHRARENLRRALAPIVEEKHST